MLSPLSWWNDLFFNLPIAYGFAYLATWWHREWFISAAIVGYWLSNVLGFVLMQLGAADLVSDSSTDTSEKSLTSGKKYSSLWITLGSSTLYTLIILGLVYLQLLDLPDFASLKF